MPNHDPAYLLPARLQTWGRCGTVLLLILMLTLAVLNPASCVIHCWNYAPPQPAARAELCLPVASFSGSHVAPASDQGSFAVDDRAVPQAVYASILPPQFELAPVIQQEPTAPGRMFHLASHLAAPQSPPPRI